MSSFFVTYYSSLYSSLLEQHSSEPNSTALDHSLFTSGAASSWETAILTASGSDPTPKPGAQLSTVVVTGPPEASTDSAKDTDTSTNPSAQQRTSTIAGVTVGIPVGLAAVAFVYYLLRRRHQANTTKPDPSSDSAMYQKAELDSQPVTSPKSELDTQPNTLAELGHEHFLKELDTDPNSLAELPSIFAELEGSRVHSELDATSDLNRSSSLVTSGYDRRSSAVSSLAPRRGHRPVAGGSPMGAALQAVSQQRPGNNDEQSDSVSQKDVRCVHSYQSGMLPVLEGIQSEASLSQELRSIGQVELEEKSLDGKTTQPGQHALESKTTPEDVKVLHSEGAMQDNISQEISGQETANKEHASEDNGVRRDDDLYRGQQDQEDRAAHEAVQASPAAEAGSQTGSVIATPQQGKDTAK